MRIPKYVDDLLKRRTNLAKRLDRICYQIDSWLNEHGIEPDPSCYLTGVEIYMNPDVAEQEVRTAIQEK